MSKTSSFCTHSDHPKKKSRVTTTTAECLLLRERLARNQNSTGLQIRGSRTRCIDLVGPKNMILLKFALEGFLGHKPSKENNAKLTH